MGANSGRRMDLALSRRLARTYELVGRDDFPELTLHADPVTSTKEALTDALPCPNCHVSVCNESRHLRAGFRLRTGSRGRPRTFTPLEERFRLRHSPMKSKGRSKGMRNRPARSKSAGQTGTKRAVGRQRRNEQRKLDHRRDQADRLRDISERNGNERLRETADRIETKAQEHFDKRTRKIDRLEQKLPEVGSPQQLPKPNTVRQPAPRKPSFFDRVRRFCPFGG